ncbi:MAG: hypothetical protein JW984_04115 [Deltaproteobacteria bacterium]|uniref:Uncharacterized protein n=1 Tax=Candidatus Zymogenus saltonus TaxID=2844893 RepID=A0A9D8KCV5_9DELT|nr:hypothetical protein [Candidatus Zymogenus saltonus]
MKRTLITLCGLSIALLLLTATVPAAETQLFNKPGAYYVSASIDAGCSPNPAYFTIADGLTGTDLKVMGISPGFNCVTGAPADTQGFQLEAGPIIYSESKYLDNPPVVSPAPLSTITLSSGSTYTLYAYGGRNAYVVLEFKVTGGLTTPPGTPGTTPGTTPATPGTTPATPGTTPTTPGGTTTKPGSTPGGPAVSGPKTLEGKWKTDWWGVLTITINGGSVTGNYEESQGRINGTLSADGRTIKGWWSEAPTYQRPECAGIFTITLSPDGGSISGEWHFGESEYKYEMKGTRVK